LKIWVVRRDHEPGQFALRGFVVANRLDIFVNGSDRNLYHKWVERIELGAQFYRVEVFRWRQLCEIAVGCFLGRQSPRCVFSRRDATCTTLVERFVLGAQKISAATET